MERALAVLTDPVPSQFLSVLKAAAGATSGASATISSETTSSETLRAITTFADPAGTATLVRGCSALAWSPCSPEMLAAGFYDPANGRLASFGRRGGLGVPPFAYTFNVHIPAHPLLKLQTIDAPLCALEGDRGQPQVLYGASALGHVFVWDTRVGGAPVRVGLPGVESHGFPIVAFDTVGSAGLTEKLVTGSTDGRLCVWNPASLHAPVDVLEMSQVSKATLEVGALPDLVKADFFLQSLAINQSDSSRFAVGAESGMILSVNGLTSRNADFVATLPYHLGVVTTLAWHPAIIRGVGVPADVTSLLLAGGSDGAITLWPKAADPRSSKSTPRTEIDTGTGDVTCARWSPGRAGVFAAATTTGDLRFHSLADDAATPAAMTTVDSFPGFTGSTKMRPITRLAFNADGGMLLAGHAAGGIALLSLPKTLAAPQAVCVYSFLCISNSIR